MTLLTSSQRLARIRPRIVLALGLTSGLVVGLVSLLDFGNPRVEARADAVRDAETRAESIRLARAALRRAPRLPDSITERVIGVDPRTSIVLGTAASDEASIAAAARAALDRMNARD